MPEVAIAGLLAGTVGVIPASGTEVSFLQPLYKYANLDLPFSPNDPGLQWTATDSTLVNQLLIARFFNLLNEPSTPLPFFLGNTAVNISGIATSATFECLDVREFGAIGDGVTDDTAAIQRALNQAYSNYLHAQALTISGALIVSGAQVTIPVESPGPTIVCIPSGLICCVYPTWIDTTNILDGTSNGGSNVVETIESGQNPNPGQPSSYFNLSHVPASIVSVTVDGVAQYSPADYGIEGATLVFNFVVQPTQYVSADYFWDSGDPTSAPPNWDGNPNSLYPFNGGYTCLQIDTGVTLQLDGVLKLGNDLSKSYQRWYNQYYGPNNNTSSLAIYLIENRNAFVGGPFFSQQNFPNPLAISYDDFLLDYELGPRDTNVMIKGQGIMDCNGLQFWNGFWSPLSDLDPGVYGNGPFDPNIEVCAIRFVKADNSIIDGITIQNATTYASEIVDVENSRNVLIQNITVTDVYNDAGVFISGAAITFQAVRVGVIQLCTITQFGGGAIALWGCQRCNVTDNVITHGLWGPNSGGTTGGLDMIAVYDWDYNLEWFFSDELQANTNVARNQIVTNRGRHWTPGTFYATADVVTPPRGYVNDYTLQMIGNFGGISTGGGESGSIDQEPSWPDPVAGQLTRTYQDGGPWYNVYEAIGSEADEDTVINPAGNYATVVGIHLYGADGWGILMDGIRVSENHIDDNFGIGIQIRSLRNGQVQDNYVDRNQIGGIWQEYEDVLSDTLSIQNNEGYGNGTVGFGPGAQNLYIEAIGIHETVDNPQIAASTTSIGGATSNTVVAGTNFTYSTPITETLAGTADGVNAVFLLSELPVSGSLTVYLNGLAQSAGTDYTQAGVTVTFSTAPASGSTVTATYQFQ